MERLLVSLVLAGVLLIGAPAPTSAEPSHAGLWNPTAHLDASRVMGA